MIGIVKIVNKNESCLKKINSARIASLEYNHILYKLEYEINDGKITAEILNVKLT